MVKKISTFCEESLQKKASDLYEKELQEQWNHVPLSTLLKTVSGIEFKVISRGIYNHGAGPDFLNARIDFSGTVKQGDVEIHRTASDWIVHGHQNDPAYANVILHAVDVNDPTPSNVPFLPDTPVFLFSDLPRPEAPVKSEGMCAAWFRQMDNESLQDFAESAGLERMHLKSEKLLHNMIREGTQDVFREALFEQIGVPDNRDEFKQLSKRLARHSLELLHDNFEALLWGESGLLPDPADKHSVSDDARDTANDLWNRWWKLRLNAQGPLPFSRTCRPLNSPERRIALLSLWYQEFSTDPFRLLEDIIRKDDPVGELTLLFSSKNDFWSKHTSFRSAALKKPSALIGKSRIIELLTDVLLPALDAYASLKKDTSLRSRIDEVFRSLVSPGSNRTMRIMLDYVFPGREKCIRSSAAVQGLIHLYKNYCERHAFDCRTCEIYRSFQNEGDQKDDPKN